jgi:hypothetical protein
MYSRLDPCIPLESTHPQDPPPAPNPLTHKTNRPTPAIEFADRQDSRRALVEARQTAATTESYSRPGTTANQD